MSGELSPIDKAKFVAAKRAVDYVEDGMRVGLGTGSTAAWMVRCLGEMVREDGLRVTGVPTSAATARQAEALGIPLTTLDETPWLDLTIDGADEIGPGLALVKGGGGALLREKIVAAASGRMLVIADASKRVGRLGAFPLPVEIVRFGARSIAERVRGAIAALGLPDGMRLRMAGEAPFVTDEGHHILDLSLAEIPDPDALDATLSRLPGVVETGLFLDLASEAIVGHPDGRVERVPASG